MKNANVMAKNKLTTTPKPQYSTIVATTVDKLKYDCDIMLDYAIKRGIPLPKDIALDNSDLSNEEMIANYNELTSTILPATVESIVYIKTHVFSNKTDHKWHSPPGYSKSFIISIIALLVVIGTSLFPFVNDENLSKGLLDSSGTTLLFHLIFICSAALLGVMFFFLKSINDKIKSYTLTKIDVLELNSTILVGVISGFLISEVFSSIFMAQINESIVVTKMTLAILGGFASDAIFSILQGIVHKMKSFLSHTP